MTRAQLVIAGDGPERARLEALARSLGVGDRVHFLGFQSDLPELVHQLDVVVNCSRNEGTPVALIEAMAAEVPVVATCVGGSPDLLRAGRLGRLVPPADPVSLSTAIIASLSDSSDQQRRIRTARTWVLENYGARRLIRDVERLYTGLLASRGHRVAPGAESWSGSARTQLN